MFFISRDCLIILNICASVRDFNGGDGDDDRRKSDRAAQQRPCTPDGSARCGEHVGRPPSRESGAPAQRGQSRRRTKARRPPQAETW